MKLGDFFSTAPYARPVNAKPIFFTATTRRGIMPGGKRNPTDGGTVAATVKGGFVFLGGDVSAEARLAARDHLEKIRKDAKSGEIKSFDGVDIGQDLTYQLLWRVLFEWDEEKARAGDDRLFETVQLLREMVEPQEASRILKAYDAYVSAEHPEAVDPKTFRGAASGDQGAPAAQSA